MRTPSRPRRTLRRGVGAADVKLTSVRTADGVQRGSAFSPASALLSASLALALLLVTTSQAAAQQQTQSTSQPSAVAGQQARAELAVVTELGRLFGSIVRMHESDPDLELRRTQAESLRALTREIRASERLSADRAGSMIDEIHTAILGTEQRAFIDERTVSQPESAGGSSAPVPSERTPLPSGGDATPSADSSGDGTGDRSAARGSGSPQSSPGAESAAPANPLLDPGRQIGRFYAELCELLAELQ